MSDTGEGDGEMLRISQSESILTDMTHVISPTSAKSPLSSRSRGEPHHAGDILTSPSIISFHQVHHFNHIRVMVDQTATGTRASPNL